MKDDIETELLGYVRENFLPRGARARLSATDDLFETATLDSVGLITTVEHIEKRFGLKISDDDLLPDNFSSVRRAAAFIRGQMRRRPSVRRRKSRSRA